MLPGGTGTLLELALVWELINKRLIDPRIPLVLLGDHWTPLLPPIRAAQPHACDLATANDVPAAVSYLRNRLGEPVSDPGDPGPRP